MVPEHGRGTSAIMERFRTVLTPRRKVPTMNARPAVDGKYEKLKSDLQALSGDVAKLIQEIPSMVTDVRDESLQAARERVNRMQQQIDASLSQIVNHGRDAARGMGDVTRPVAHEIEDALYSHPIATIALAVGIGWLLGASWKR
jgi:ElaB/YqjD/DUF883 family membrane-anchored ribosome-binding protein